MSEPRKARSRGGKEAVLASAVSNFQLLGYHGTSMRDIARDSNMTVASIYHHFASKQEILFDIMVQVLSDLILKTRTALKSTDSAPRNQLEAMVTAWILFHVSRQAEAFIGSTEIRSLDPQGRRFVVALRDEQEHMFRDVINRGVFEGSFATPYPREATRAIINMGSSVSAWFDPNGDLSPEALAERYVTLALGTVEALS
jgi:AcrR family transcriptional regulator